MSDQFFSISPDLASRYINLALIALKKQGITQQEVGEKIEFSSLSKAKKFSQYKNRNSNLIGGKSLNEVLHNIVEAYSLHLDDKKANFIISDSSILHNDLAQKNALESCYLFHYYTDSVNGINRGILSFKTSGEVVLTIISPFNKELRNTWKGTFKFTNMYLFVELNSGSDSSFTSLHTYFAGIANTWLDYFQGTYNGIRADGTLLVGKSLLERVVDEQKANELIHEPIDDRVKRFLDGSIISVNTELIGSLNIL